MMCFENIQNQFAFLSQALGPNFVHLARLIDCSPGTPAGIELDRWDTSLMGALSKITGQPLSHQARQLARIPKRNGGLGVWAVVDCLGGRWQTRMRPRYGFVLPCSLPLDARLDVAAPGYCMLRIR